MAKVSSISWFKKVPVFCDGTLILFTQSTKPQLMVDNWSGIHNAYKKYRGEIVDGEKIDYWQSKIRRYRPGRT
uniref:Ribosomal protein L31 n=1 Tax=Chromera velia TaxID=505693 RepID=D9IXD8_9ALVE|nr:ribosomal protein L31 [Chromera velia]ADJ66546.1 ribosomal protein L31 [Chromera velia]